MPEHADISDYLAHFGDEAFTTVQELIKNTPLWQPSPEQQTSTGFECFTAASLLSQYIEPPKYIVNSLLSEGLTVLAGPPKYVTLCFLKEPHINTETYRQTIQRQISPQLKTGNAATDSFVSSVIAALNQYTVDLAKEQIRLAFAQAQKEVDDLHQRTREGMLTAKLNGKQIGQKRGRKLVVKKAAACKDAIKKYSKDFDGTLSDADCIKLIGIARNTYYKYKWELREAMPV